TWREVAGVLPAAKCRIEKSALLYETDATGYLRRIVEAPDAETLLVIGHNPSIQDLALLLAGSGDADAMARLSRGMVTAGLAVLAFDGKLSGARPGGGRLEAFIAPAP